MMKYLDLESLAIYAVVLGIAVALIGSRFHALRLIAAGLFVTSLVCIVGYVCWLRFGVPMSNTNTCYDSTIINCGFGAGRNQFKLGGAAMLLGLFALANVGGLALVILLRINSRNNARL
jgi:hypothetical protein